MNPDFPYVIFMIFGLICYINGVVGLFFYTYSLTKKRTGVFQKFSFKKNKHPYIYDIHVGFVLISIIISFILGFVLLIFSLYMIVGLFVTIVILFLLIIVIIFLTVNVCKRLKIIFEKQEELRRKNIQQMDESILQKLSKEK